MMGNEERKKVFWLLKKYSSYSAWNALSNAYLTFAEAWMLAMRSARAADVDEFNKNATKRILSGRIAFEHGLEKLRRGDRSVWRLGSAGYAGWGALQKASEQMDFIAKIMDPAEYVFDWMPNKNEVVAAHEALQDARFGQESIMEPQPGQPAPAAPWNILATVHPVYGFPLNDPKHMNFPYVLPDVPAPSLAMVSTASIVQFDGIYEPVWSDKLNVMGFFGLGLPSGKLQPAGKVGCMNYLLAHAVAPTYRDNELDPPTPVTWRLIWKDERYLDGSIPDEEKEYLLPIEEPAREVMRCDSGQPCPRAGYWFTPAKAGSHRYFQAGEIMPSFESAYGLTIWQWDENQNA